MKNVLKRIGLIALAVCFAIGSFFIPNSSFASASTNRPSIVPPPSVGDVTTTNGLSFTGSDIIYSSISFRTNGTLVTDFSLYSNSSDSGYFYNSAWSYLNFCFGIDILNNNLSIKYFANRGSLKIFPVGTIQPEPGVFYSTPVNNIDYSSFASSFVSGGVFDVYGVTPMQVVDAFGSYYYFNFGFEIYRNNSETDTYIAPNLDMYYCILTNSFEFEQYLGFAPKFVNTNIICYIDSNGYYYIFYVPSAEKAFSANNRTFYLQYRRYILQDLDLSNNQIYQQGLQDGFASGRNNGINEGYSSGYDIGYDDGFENGKLEGVIESNNYSFFGLISAIIDAPVKILTSLFNFNFLGVNLWAFFTSILTISLVIFVIRKFMAKG